MALSLQLRQLAAEVNHMRSILTCLVLVTGIASAAGDYAVKQRFAIGGPGGWDYLTVDSSSNRLFIARADRVLVVDTLDGSLLGTIAHTEGVHGVALAPDLGKGFISDGRADSVTVFDLATLATLATIAVPGHNPDAIVYDKASRRVFTFNGGSHDITVIDPVKGSVLATLAAGGKPEFAQADGAGHIFFNIEDTAQISEIDARSAKRIGTWSLPKCEEPTGLAFDVAHGRLFSTCGNRTLIVTDAASGRHIASVPIGDGPDGAIFDAARGLLFSSNGEDGTLTVIHQDDPDHYSVVATVATQKSARTLELDAKTHLIYSVAAEFGPAPAPTPDQPHPRPAVLEGSFKVLVIGN
jgi:DNA-binding beta-propeller fold protein YncE